MSENKNLIMYDFLLVKGGAESLTLTLCEALENLDLCVGFVDRTCFDEVNIPGLLFELTTTTKLLGWQSLKVSWAFESHRAAKIQKYEKVIYSGSNAPLAVTHHTQGCNILYCHTPPRFIYDLRQHYLTTIAPWQRPLLKLLIAFLQRKYEAAIDKMDIIIANSKNVQRRIEKHLNKKAIVIYPPCDTESYSWLSQGDYYLSTARVEPYKRIKLIVEAFINMPGKKLIVASGGSDLAQLQMLAKNYRNISFTGWCESPVLIELMGNCIATIYLPMDEDFGISPVESMAAGKPVIGVDEGGVRETVIDEETGILCPQDPSVKDIMNAVNKMTPSVCMAYRSQCEIRAKLFSVDIFTKKMKTLLESKPEQLLVTAMELDS